MEVIRLGSAEELRLWDDAVAASPQANPFSVSTWLQAASETVGGGFDCWVALRGAEWVGGLGLLWTRRFGRKAAWRPAFMPYATVWFSGSTAKSSYASSNTAARHEICESLLTAVVEEYSTVSLSLLNSVADVRPWIWGGWDVAPSYTYLIDLTSKMRLSHSVRKHLRHAEQAGLEHQPAWRTDALVSTVRAMESRQGVSYGLPASRMAVFTERMRDAGLAQMDSVYAPDGKPLCSRIQLRIPATPRVFDWIAGSVREGFSVGATSLLMVRVAQRCGQEGAKTWDLCGANFRSIAGFKANFGGELVHGFQASSSATLLERAYRSSRKLGSTVLRTARRSKRD